MTINFAEVQQQT